MTVAVEPQPRGARGMVHYRRLDTGHFALETQSEEVPDVRGIFRKTVSV
jgi:hypothetical protein